MLTVRSLVTMEKRPSQSLSGPELGPTGSLPVTAPGPRLLPPDGGDGFGVVDGGRAFGGDVEGARYSGQTLRGLRHGRGRLAWRDGQLYVGEFFRDHCHGLGEHVWPDGSRFLGRFYLGRREGYGTFTFPDGSTFQGLYASDRRFGPGVRSYGDGRQDVGIWLGERLVKLCVHLPNIAPAVWPPEEVTSLAGANPREVTSRRAERRPRETAATVEPSGASAGKSDREQKSELAQREVASHAAKREAEPAGDMPPNAELSNTRPLWDDAGVGRPWGAREASSPPRDTDASGGMAPAIVALCRREPRSLPDLSGTDEDSDDSADDGARPDDRRRGNGGVARSPGPVRSSGDGFDKALMKQVQSDPLGYRFQQLALHDGVVLPPGMERYSTDAQHLPLTASYLAACDARFFRAREAAGLHAGSCWRDRHLPVRAWLRTHARAHGEERCALDCRAGDILEGRRVGFGPRGPLEEASERLLAAAARGDGAQAFGPPLTHPDVADARGRTALHVAAVNCQEDTIHLLLDWGADVNALTDDGISPLLACLMLYYAQEAPAQGAIGDRPETPEADGAAASRWDATPPTESGRQWPPTPRVSPSDSGVDVRDRASALCEEPPRRGRGGRCHRPMAASRGPGKETAPSAEGGPLEPERSGWTGHGPSGARSEDEEGHSTSSEFRSTATLRAFAIAVSDKELELSAEALSRLRRDEGAARDGGGGENRGGGGGCCSGRGGADEEEEEEEGEGRARKLATLKHKRRRLWATALLLLERGADPGAGGRDGAACLLLAASAGDARALRLLLQRGAPPDQRLPPQMGGLPALLVAAGTPGPRGFKMVSLLLHAAADPDVRAPFTEGAFFPPDQGADHAVCGIARSDAAQAEVPSQLQGHPQQPPAAGGLTALHVACQRSDNPQCVQAVVRLLLRHGASADPVWAGHSPLSLAVACGNLPAAEELLSAGADPDLALPRGVGSALCAAANPGYAHGGLDTASLLALIDRLIAAGASVLSPIRVRDGARLAVGTVVDFAFMRFYQDRRIAHTPYHALSPSERAAFTARRAVLAHLGAALRRAAVARERRRLEALAERGVVAVGPSKRFVYTGAGATVPTTSGPSPRSARRSPSPRSSQRRETRAGADTEERSAAVNEKKIVRRFLLRFCYGCGRAVGVRLSPCSRCREVLYCSRACTVAAWAGWHRDECVRVPGQRSRQRKGRLHAALDGKTARQPAVPSCSENYSFN